MHRTAWDLPNKVAYKFKQWLNGKGIKYNSSYYSPGVTHFECRCSAREIEEADEFCEEQMILNW